MKQKLGELRLKKAREIIKSMNENEQQQEDIEDVSSKLFKSRDLMEAKFTKKQTIAEIFPECKTTPLISQQNSESQSRSKKFRVSKML